MSKSSILLIDDTEANRYSVGRVLQKEGYNVFEAATCKEGLQHIEVQKLSLIILDVQLPDGNGYELCAKLKADPATQNIPILMTSASFVKSRDKAYGLNSGADGYLTTPVDPLELLATVKALLRVREAEEKLQKSQEIFRTLADSIPALVWMAGTDKRCYYFNKAWLAFTGRSFEQEDGDGWAASVHPDDLARCKALYTESFDQRISFEMTYRLKRHDGQYRWILNRGEPHYNLDGSFAGYTGASIDVHDNLMAEKKLQESEERFDLAMKGMNDGLWDYSPLTGSIYFSPRFKAMLGYKENEYSNSIENWTNDLHPEDREQAWARVNAYLSGESEKYKNFFRMKHKDGSYRWILSRGIAVRDKNGKALRFVGAHTDVTEQKELESELRKAYQKAEAASNAKSEFLANMSHEIRTPMNAVIGLANILSTTPLNERQKEFITTLQLSAETLLTLINDMLDITKIEDNMIELESAAFSLHELMERIIGMMSVKANEKRLQLHMHLENTQHDYFIGDSLRLQQVIVNLLNNALKFTEQGNVTITIMEKPTDNPAVAKLTVHISDTGIGIAQDKLYAIFDKFTQGDSSITRRYGGSGLGLTISKALIERMKGNIHVSSELGKGSTFTINIPLRLAQNIHASEEMEGSDSEQQQSDERNKLILLVEDYPPNILVATILLNEFGYHYDIATDGRQALVKLAEKEFDIVLMDVQMQGMDGYETTRRIRDHEEKEGTPPLHIIAMTAHALSGDREKCLEAGMDDYISKPFNPMELRSKLAAV